jgi:hypothetical protein
MIAAAVLSVLAVIGTIMNSRQATAQDGGPKVTIESPIPLPVTGSLGITGTANVLVTNPATAPVLFLNVNDPGRIPYQSEVLGTCDANACITFFPVVPANHRLVIQHFSGEITFSGSPSPLAAVLRGAAGFGPAQSSSMVTANIPAQGPFHATSLFDQSVLLYFDAGKQPLTQVSAPNIQFADITLTGYMLDCTIAPCAAIAQ